MIINLRVLKLVWERVPKPTTQSRPVLNSNNYTKGLV